MAMKVSSLKNSGGGANLLGNYIAEERSGLRTYTLSWDNPTIFKPLPFVENQETILPHVFEDDPDTLTDWIVELPYYVRSAGQTRKITFNSELHGEDVDRFTETPYARLLRMVRQLAKEEGPRSDWDAMLKGGNNASPVVPKIKSTAAMQGILYMHDGKDYSKDPRANILLCLSPSAAQSIATLMHLKTEDCPEGMGNLFSKNPVKMLHFQRSDNAFSLLPKWDVFLSNPKDDDADNNREFKTHVVRVVTPPERIKVPGDDYARRNFKPWNDVMRKLSVKEQLELLCSAYNLDVIEAVFSSSEFMDELPKWVTDRLFGTTEAPNKRQPAALNAQNDDDDDFGDYEFSDDFSSGDDDGAEGPIPMGQELEEALQPEAEQVDVDEETARKEAARLKLEAALAKRHKK